jgi:hypothetical protein
MSTFVSMITWAGDARPHPVEVRAAVDARFSELRDAGFHSLVFLPEDRACTAVMVASCDDEDGAERIASAIWPDCDVRVESMRFDDDDVPAWIGREATAPRPSDYLAAVLDALVSA